MCLQYNITEQKRLNIQTPSPLGLISHWLYQVMLTVADIKVTFINFNT